ncbi:MAG: glycogen/starch synthase [bacterium]|nr:glycogen/starch synthase [bacterium]
MRLKVVSIAPEMLKSNLPRHLCDANYKGGLGKLEGCFERGLGDMAGIESICFMPLYKEDWHNRDIVFDYRKELGEPWRTVSTYVDGTEYPVSAWDLSQNSQKSFGIASPAFEVLYVSDRKRRLIMELVYGQAVPKFLKEIGFRPDVFWPNESHTAFTLPYARQDPFFGDFATLFTIHTPEEAGLEKFYGERYESLDLPKGYLDTFVHNGVIDLARAAMIFSDTVNAVSREHGDVTRRMFPEYAEKITHVTNGTDIRFWRNPHLAHHAGYGSSVSDDALMHAHTLMREQSLRFVEDRTGAKLDPAKPVAWFVRRFAQYKNLHPFLSPILSAVCADRGTRIATEFGELAGLGMQVVGAGRAPETDRECMWWMQDFGRVASNGLRGSFAFMPDYRLDILLAGVQGADLWIVTPEPGREACGTSDRDAAHNGIPSVASCTGGMKEWMTEFNANSYEGNGFFINPYNPRTLYEKMRTFSDLWYAWREHGDQAYVRLKQNVLQASPALDIRPALAEYEKLFWNMIAKKHERR